MALEQLPSTGTRTTGASPHWPAVVEAIPVGQAGQIEEDLIYEVPMPRTNTLYLNTEEGPFEDPEVRAAAREAIDRAALVEGVYEAVHKAIPQARRVGETDYASYLNPAVVRTSPSTARGKSETQPIEELVAQMT